MPLFAYRAVTGTGRIVSGRCEAADSEALAAQLLLGGADLLSARRLRGAKLLFPARHRVAPTELIAFCFHLEQISRAGVPLIDGLGDLRDDHRPGLGSVIASLAEAIRGGRTLSQAMARFPGVFDTVFVHLVRAGEASGCLAEVFGRLGENLRKEEERRARLRVALSYPAFVALFAAAAAAFLLLYLVPQLRHFVLNLGETLPLHARLLFSLSDFTLAWWPVLLAAATILPALIIPGSRRHPHLRRQRDALLLRLPLLGEIVRKTLLARFADTFALLYAAGIPVLDGLALTEGVVGNLAVRERLAEARRSVGEGRQLSAGFAETGFFPALLIRMLRLGESTGELDKTLSRVAYFYGREVDETMARLERLTEPVLTLLLGALLGWIVLSVLGPIYDVLSRTRI